ncbi:MAG: TolC family protein, partial [Bacteroidales bacterium]|nr:TolC family protein [Bacteroidales bacterium]
RDTVSLIDCHRFAIETHPLFQQKDLYMQSKELNLKNHSVNWYPSLDLNGRYTWQNEVVQLPFAEAIPGFEKPFMPHYNYKLTLDVQQTLYDGGVTRMGKELEESRYEVNRQKVEVNLNQLKDQVNNIYFFILLLQQQEKTILLKLEELKERLSVMESGVRNETILSSDRSVLKAESRKVRQQLAEISISRKSALSILENLTSLEISEQPVLELPVAVVEPAMETIRPEQMLYDLQIRNLDASIRLAERQRYPKAFVFGQLGYGNPALNFFRDEFRGYYIVGAGLQWNVWDWSKTSRTRQDLTVQQELIQTRKEAFNKNLSIQMEEQMAEIIKYREAVQRDEEILNLRGEITRAAVSKLENGVITSTVYITQLNAETEARILLEMHRIQLKQARIRYLTTKGII